MSEPAAFRVEMGGAALRSYGRYGAGEAHAASAADGCMRERMHASTCLGVVVSGRFEFRTPAGAATATPGSMIFGHAGESFSFRYLDADGARRSVIALSEELISELERDCGLRQFPVAVIPPLRSTTSLYGMTRAIARAPSEREEDVYELVAAALSVAREIRFRAISRHERGRVREVARYIEAEYARSLPLASLAEIARLSKFHFLRAFRAEIGESPGRYLGATRLRAAVDRLIATRESIATIALGVGFNDLSHFNAMFRTTFGMSPRAFREATRA
jgi:AraC-like DNA-binding protein